MRAKPLLLAVLLLVAAGAGYAVWWAQVARTAEARIAGWIAEQRARAAFVDYGTLTVDGFPLRVRATLTDLSYRRPDGALWQAPRVEAEAAPWDVTNVALRLPAPQRAVLPAEGLRPPVEAVAESGSGRLDFGLDGRLESAVVTLAAMSIGSPAAGGEAPVTVDRLVLQASEPPDVPQAHTDPGLVLDVLAEGVRLPPGADTPLGPAVERVAAAIRVMGPPPAELEPALLAAWSRAGGTVEVERVDVRWGPLGLQADGTLALDADLQPIGALTARIRGHEKALDAFAQDGYLRPNEANMAKIGLGLLARPSEAGEPEVTAPLTIQDGALFLGPIRLAAVPRIDWN